MDIDIGEVKRDLLSETIYKTIRDNILDGKIAAGQHLRELEIAKLFETSQAPVREAFRQLQREGLIINMPFKGNFVYDIDDTEIEEIYKLRHALEVISLNWLLKRLKKQNIIDLQEIVANMKKASVFGLVSKVVEADVDFHMYICREASNYTNLLGMWRMINGKTRLAIAKYDRDLFSEKELSELVGMHQGIVDALKTNNESKLIEAYNKHMKYVYKDLLQGVQKE